MAKIIVQYEGTDEAGRAAAVDAAVRKFKKMTLKEGVIYEWKRRQYFMTKSEKRQEKSNMAKRRAKNKKLR